MIDTICKAISDMENGVTNYCKDGQCIGCGECCSALLPLSEKEIRTIKKYVKKHNLKPHVHFAAQKVEYDLTCPFLDGNKKKHKCDIYEVRPEICRKFICCTPPSKIKENKERFWKTRNPVYMWDVFE